MKNLQSKIHLLFKGKNNLLFFLVFSFLTFLSPSTAIFAQQTPNYQGGEELTYKIYYNLNFVWVAAGEVTFNVNDMGNQWHLKAVGRTYKSYEWFFKVRDTYEAYLDKYSLLPTVSIRDVHEGNYNLYDKVVFDQTNKLAVSYRKKNTDVIDKKEIKTTNFMHDLVSMLYYCRTINFSQHQKGDNFPLCFFMDREEYPINVLYNGKVPKVNIKELGTFNTIKFSPKLNDGRVFKDGYGMSIWASDDENKVPLMIESPLSVGKVKVVLKSYKNLKYDLSAQTKG
jgi:Protein of unknown function (DUF3108)